MAALRIVSGLTVTIGITLLICTKIIRMHVERLSMPFYGSMPRSMAFRCFPRIRRGICRTFLFRILSNPAL